MHGLLTEIRHPALAHGKIKAATTIFKVSKYAHMGVRCSHYANGLSTLHFCSSFSILYSFYWMIRFSSSHWFSISWIEELLPVFLWYLSWRLARRLRRAMRPGYLHLVSRFLTYCVVSMSVISASEPTFKLNPVDVCGEAPVELLVWIHSAPHVSWISVKSLEWLGGVLV